MQEQSNQPTTVEPAVTSAPTHVAAPVSKPPFAQLYAIPLAILAVGIMLTAAVVFTGPGNVPNAPTAAPVVADTGSTDAVRPVTTEDHIKGNPNAAVKIVEYSDMECPFCKLFHQTMNTVMDKYGASGEVAWVFRQFPLDQLHPKNARIVAQVSECATEQGGNDMFWKFTDRWFDLTATNDRTDLTVVLPKIYNELGLDKAKIDSCVASGKYDQHIKDDEANAIATGGRGTPWSVVIGADGKTYPLNGAQPIAAVEQLINIAKKSK